MSDDAPQLNAANIDNELVRLDWNDITSSIFHPIWLRDNCGYESCGDFHSSLRIITDRLGLARDANPLTRGAYGSCEHRGQK